MNSESGNHCGSNNQEQFVERIVDGKRGKYQGRMLLQKNFSSVQKSTKSAAFSFVVDRSSKVRQSQIKLKNGGQSYAYAASRAINPQCKTCPLHETELAR
jgi:hypothetical protein